MSEYKDPHRVVSGLKASIHNPRVSSEAKESASRRLEEMGSGAKAPTRGGGLEETASEEGRAVPGGLPQSEYTAGRIGPRKDQTLAQQEKEFETAEQEDRGESQGKYHGAVSGQPGGQHVLGGYKATLKNPKVSEEAKEHAQQILRDNEAL